MPVEDVVWLIAGRDHHDGNIRQGSDATDDGRSLFQTGEVIGHRTETLRFAPERLDERTDLRRELAHLANEVLQRSCRDRAEQPRHIARNTGRAAGEEGEARAYDANAREDAAEAREVNTAPQEPCLATGELVPLAWWIQEDDACDVRRIL